jgi:hypothetical protein
LFQHAIYISQWNTDLQKYCTPTSAIKNKTHTGKKPPIATRGGIWFITWVDPMSMTTFQIQADGSNEPATRSGVYLKLEK